MLLAQIVATGSLACWLTTKVVDNLLHLTLNETYAAEVMSMTRLREDYPDACKQVAQRAVTNRKQHILVFRIVVAAQLVAVMLLWVGTAASLSCLIGFVADETSHAIAMVGATAFLAIWSAFLIVGNYFSYWFCHEGAQNTHYQMTLWSLGVLILLAQS